MRTKAAREKRRRKPRKNSSRGSVISRFLLFVSRIPPVKRDLAIDEGDQSAIRDGDAMGVGAEIT
jgi:hypothetical protein